MTSRLPLKPFFSGEYKKSFICLLGFLFSLLLFNIAVTAEVKKVLPTPADDDSMGYSVDISGDYAIVGVPLRDSSTIGADIGTAYIYHRSGTAWNLQAELAASNAATGDKFGWSVAIDGDYAVVGAPERDSSGVGADAGRAYVFYRSGSTWNQQAQLFSTEPGEGDEFGCSVSIDGNSAIVGARLNDDTQNDAGAAYVFVRSGTSWSQQQQLTPNDPANNDWFGFSVAISGDYAIAGAYLDDDSYNQAGSAYIFVRSGSTWSQQQKLVASDPHAFARFGYSVDLDGDKAVVGAYWYDIPPTPLNRAGAVYIYRRDGSSWSEEEQLSASDADEDEFFGESVSIDGDYLVVGTPGKNLLGTGDAGVIYSFLYTGSGWTQRKRVAASDSVGNANFGASVAVDGDYTIVGAYRDSYDGYTDAGSAYLYESFGDLSLPVELISFSANAASGQVILNWSTASELNNVGFIIERRGEEQQNFTEIASYLTHASLKGQFNSSTLKEYSFTDPNIVSGKTYQYKLFDVDVNGNRNESGQLQVSVPSAVLVKSLTLHSAFPNPFNPSTTLRIEIANPDGDAGVTRLEIFNILGQKVTTIFEGKLETGSHEFKWHGKTDAGNDVAGGIYYVVLTSGRITDMKRLVYLR